MVRCLDLFSMLPHKRLYGWFRRQILRPYSVVFDHHLAYFIPDGSMGLDSSLFGPYLIPVQAMFGQVILEFMRRQFKWANTVEQFLCGRKPLLRLHVS